MQQDKRPDVVDLRSYRRDRARSQAQAARRKAAPQRPSGKEPLLGSRRNAGLILALLILLGVALWFGPRMV